ncbi:hypothetical protein NMG60_11006789 [Bertholletia excelsa]
MRGRGKSGAEKSGDGDCGKSMIDRIMLRFRPIAPKPAGDGSPASESASVSDNLRVAKARAKRKYVRVRARQQCAGSKKESGAQHRRVLPLRSPQGSAEGEDLFSVGSCFNLDSKIGSRESERSLVWLNFENLGSADVAAGVVESWVTVECVTDTCVEGGGLGLMDLEGDTCPWLVSDCHNLVQWVNVAYKEMITRGDRVSLRDEEFRVWLVMKEGLPQLLFPAFACRVRVEYTCRGRKQSRTVPCDVWRIDGGGFAWRLDVKAALSLGL